DPIAAYEALAKTPQDPPAPVVGLCPPDPFGRGARRHPALVLVRAPFRDIPVGRRPLRDARPRPDHPPPRASPQDVGPYWIMKAVPGPDRLRGWVFTPRRARRGACS